MDTQSLSNTILNALLPSWDDVFQIIFPIITYKLTKYIVKWLFDWTTKNTQYELQKIINIPVVVFCLFIALSSFVFYDFIMSHKIETLCLAISFICIVSGIKKIYYCVSEYRRFKNQEQRLP